MCGRCFCTLEPPNLSKACSFKTENGKFQQVSWNDDAKTEKKYKPSPNMGPRDYLPVVASGRHFGSEENRILRSMLWGMVPLNYTDDPKKHKAQTHNARIETIRETSYKHSLANGCRCVVIAQGYYEWQTTESGKFKQPYFIYPTQKEGLKIEDPSTWKNEWSEENGWEGPSVIRMAGIFRKTKSVDVIMIPSLSLMIPDNPAMTWNLRIHSIFKIQGEVTFSCSIITRESNEVLSWLHHRTPIFLQNAEDENAWLDNKQVPMETALERITKLTLLKGLLTWHSISTSVNDVRYKNPDCIMSSKPKKKEDEKSKTLMSSWLKGSTKRVNESQQVGEDTTKKLKEI